MYGQSFVVGINSRVYCYKVQFQFLQQTTANLSITCPQPKSCMWVVYWLFIGWHLVEGGCSVVNKLVCCLIMSVAEKLLKNVIFGQEAKLLGQMWNSTDNLSARDIISWHTSKPERVYLFHNPLINFHI